MAAEDLVPCIARSSAIVRSMQGVLALVHHGEGMQMPVQSQHCEMKYTLAMCSQKKQIWQGLFILSLFGLCIKRYHRTFINCEWGAFLPWAILSHLPRRPRLRLNIKTVFRRYRDSHVKDRWSWDCLIFNMGIPILIRRHLYIETVPWLS